MIAQSLALNQTRDLLEIFYENSSQSQTGVSAEL